MTEIKKAFKNFFLCGSLYNTIIATAFILIGLAGTSGNAVEALCPTCGIDMNALHIVAEKFLTFLLLAFFFSAGTVISRISGIPKVASVFTHAGCYIIGFLIFMAVYGYGFTKSVIATVIFAVIYVIERVLQHIIVKALKKATADKNGNGKTDSPKPKKQGYTSQFSR